MAADEAPQPPYILLFEEVEPGALPLVILVDDRAAVPLFDSEERAEKFPGFDGFRNPRSRRSLEGRSHPGAGGRPGTRRLRRPKPAARRTRRHEGEDGRLAELIEALQTSPEDDLFGLGGSASSALSFH